MSGPFRLPAAAPARFGSAIDRSEPLGFRVGVKPMAGLYGDTLASALLAGGSAALTDSPLLGRPRGLMALGLEDAALFVIEGDEGPFSAISGGEIVLREGLRIQAPTSRIAGAIRRFSPPAGDRRVLPAAQQLLERLRRAVPLPGPRLRAGATPPARIETCDALVIGAGLAGLAAASALVSAGLDVQVVEATGRAGGVADLYSGTIDGRPLDGWAAQRAGELRDRHALAFGATAISISQSGLVTVVERLDQQQPGKVAIRLVSPRAIVIATGFRERPLVFPGNDRPGVMLAGAARALLRRHAVAPGAKVMIATTGDEGHRTAADLREAGVEVVLALDERDGPDGPAVEMAKALGAPVSFSTIVTSVEHDGRRDDVLHVRTQNRFGEGATTGARVFGADALIVSGGFAPRDELLAGLAETDQSVHVALAGPNAVDAVSGGWRAGLAAAASLGRTPDREAPVVEASVDEFGATPAFPRSSFTATGAVQAFVDIGADVTLADLVRAVDRRGAAASAITRRLGLGLGPDGGRLSADLPALALAALIAESEPAPRPVAGRATLGLMAARSAAVDG